MKGLSRGVTFVTRVPADCIPHAGEFLRVLRTSVRPDGDGWYELVMDVERLRELDESPPEPAADRVRWLLEGGPYAPV